MDVLQGDTVYDMIERSDVDTVMAQLESDNNSSTGNKTITPPCFITAATLSRQNTITSRKHTNLHPDPPVCFAFSFPREEFRM